MDEYSKIYSMLMSNDYRVRKAGRKAYYEHFVHGWKMRDCIACAGSGRYDNTGSPKCSSCDGTGKERYKPEAVTQ